MRKTFNIEDMQTYFRNYVPCHLHKKQPITNFCTDSKCNSYLCPQCVQQHSKTHYNHKVESIKTCIIKTRSRLEDSIKILEDETNRNSLLSPQNPEEFTKKVISEMQEIKKGLILQIQNYFKDKQNQVRKQTLKYTKIHNTLDSLRKQLLQAIKQLKIFKKNLFQTNKTMQVIQKANRIDYPMMIQHFKKKIKKIQKDLKINMKMQMNSHKRQIFRSALKDLLQLRTKDESKIKKRQQFKDSLAMDNQNFYDSHSRQIKKQFLTNAQPLSADRYFTKSSFLIQRQNYFKSGEPFLHFFQVSKANLRTIKIRDLQQNLPLKWQTINLKINFQIPSFHKTIATEQGVIYLIGGTDEHTMKKSPFIYQFSPNSQTLKSISQLHYPRSSHCLTCHHGKIYIVGGIGDNDAIRQCELFDSNNSTNEVIASCKYPTINSCVSYIQSANCLAKVGGIFVTGECNDHVEIYNTTANIWVEVDPIIDNIKGEFSLLSCSGWAAINSNQVFVFGGYDEEKDNESSSLSYIVECNYMLRYDNIVNSENNEYSIKHINAKNLPIQQGFWSPQSVIYNNTIYALQNIDGEQGGDCLEDQRNVLIFDGKYWKTFASTN